MKFLIIILMMLLQGGKIKVSSNDGQRSVSYDGYSNSFYAQSNTGFRPEINTDGQTIRYNTYIVMKTESVVPCTQIKIGTIDRPADLIMTESTEIGVFNYYKMSITQGEFNYLSNSSGYVIDIGGVRAVFNEDDRRAFDIVYDTFWEW